MNHQQARHHTSTSYDSWYQQCYPDLSGHGLWLRGGEINRLPVTDYEARPTRALFVRLSTYFDTGYSFTHQILYQIAANMPEVFPDLAFLPPPADGRLMREAEIPWLIGTQTKFGPRSFDLIGFSNSIVQELINLPAMLRWSGVPLKKSERLADPTLPLLIMGGANALYSSVLWNSDPLVDGIFVGESDQGIRDILTTIHRGKLQRTSKKDLLDQLATVPGFILPESPQPTKKYFIPNLGESEALENAPVYYLADQLGSSHLQISEGCPCFCSFCAESWDRKPYRERKAAKLKEVASRIKAGMGLDEIDIYSFNFNMHSGFYELLWDLVPLFRRIGLKSQRFDLLAHDPAMIEFQHVIEKASITCGLEGISPRLRRYLHKNLEPEQLHDSLTAIFRSRARELKVFLIATGLEEQQDLEALSDLLEHIQEILRATLAGTRVIFSMTPLVRFPWTPLEFEDGYPVEHYAQILKKVRARVEEAGFQFRESADLPEYWVSQVLVRAADSRIGAALLRALHATEFIYYRSVTPEFMRAFRQELEQDGLDTDQLLRGHTLEESAEKPWSKIETGVRRDFLWQEVQRAREYKEIDYCLGRSWTKAQCFRCGGCPTKFHIRDIVLARQTRDYTLDQFKERVRQARESRVECSLLLDVGEAARGVPRKMMAVALARALMSARPEFVTAYQGYQGSYWDTGDPQIWITGLDRITVWWQRSELPALLAALADPAFIAGLNAQLGAWGSVVGVASSEWTPEHVEIDSPHPYSGDKFLREAGLQFTARRTGEQSYR